MTIDGEIDRDAPPLAVWALALLIVGVIAGGAAVLLGTEGALAFLSGL